MTSARARAVFVRHLGPEQGAIYAEGEAARAAIESTKSPAHVLAGELAQAVDHAFMAWCEGQHQLAIQQGHLGRILHVDPPTRYVGRGLYSRTGVGPSDFQGQLTARYGGRAVAVEAKSRTGRLRLGELPEHQVKDLESCHLHGGIAVLLYEYRSDHGLRCVQFAMPWSAVPWRVTRKGAGPSIGPEECAPWKVRGLYWEELMEREARR